MVSMLGVSANLQFAPKIVEQYDLLTSNFILIIINTLSLLVVMVLYYQIDKRKQ